MARASLMNRSFTYWGVLLYSLSTLGSMAMMSVGAGVALALILVDEGGPRALLRRLREVSREPALKKYLLGTLALVTAITLSLVWANLQPLEFSGRGPTVQLRDLWKLWYFAFVPVLVASFSRLTDREWKSLLR